MCWCTVRRFNHAEDFDKCLFYISISWIFLSHYERQEWAASWCKACQPRRSLFQAWGALPSSLSPSPVVGERERLLPTVSWRKCNGFCFFSWTDLNQWLWSRLNLTLFYSFDGKKKDSKSKYHIKHWTITLFQRMFKPEGTFKTYS